MLADIARADRAEQGIDQRMYGHVGIGMTGKAVAVFDLDPAEPQFLPHLEAMDVIAGSNPDGRGGVRCEISGAKISGEGKLVQGFVSFDEGHRKASSTRHLRIIACLCSRFPVAVGGKDIGKAKGLGRLDPAQCRPIGRIAHQVHIGGAQAVHYWKNGNCPGMFRQSGNKAVNHRAGQDWPGSVVDQHVGRTGRGQALKPGENRIPPRGPAYNEANRQAGEQFRRDGFGTGRNAHHDGSAASGGKGFDGMANHWLAAPLHELFGQRLSRAQARAGRNNDCGSSGGKGSVLGHSVRAPNRLRGKGQSTMRCLFFRQTFNDDDPDASRPDTSTTEPDHGRSGKDRLPGRACADDRR